jgi:hypothetical protein
MLGEDVITLNPCNKAIEYLPVRGIIAKRYNGNMYHWQTRALDLRTTEDHNLVVLKRSKHNTNDIIFKKAKEVESRRQMLKSGQWHGEMFADCFVLPGYKNGSNSFDAVNIDWSTFSAFMGIYLSEGSTSSYKKHTSDIKVSHYEVKIYQKERNPRIEQILTQMPFKWSWFESSNSSGWRANSVQLYNYLNQFGKSYEKFVPAEIKVLSQEHIRLFLEFYLIGDGSEGRRISTSSKLMADDLQELVLKAGWSATISTRNNIGRKFSIRGKQYQTNHLTYLVNLSLKTKTVSYCHDNLTINKANNEMVYCVDVAPNHIVYVRRNGKPCWCGNCVLGQVTKTGRLIVLDTVKLGNSDVGILIDNKVLPLLHSPRWYDKARSWRDIGDRNMAQPDQSNRQKSAARVIEDKLKTRFEGGPSKWEPMKRALKGAFSRMIDGMPAIYLDPNERILHKALSGDWHYKTNTSGDIMGTVPEKTESSHIGEALANGVAIMLPAFDFTGYGGNYKKTLAQRTKRASGYAVGGRRRG